MIDISLWIAFAVAAVATLASLVAILARSLHGRTGPLFWIAAPVFLAGASLLGASVVPTYLAQRQRLPFDAERWRDATSLLGSPSVRERMAEDMMDQMDPLGVDFSGPSDETAVPTRGGGAIVEEPRAGVRERLENGFATDSGSEAVTFTLLRTGPEARWLAIAWSIISDPYVVDYMRIDRDGRRRSEGG